MATAEQPPAPWKRRRRQQPSNKLTFSPPELRVLKRLAGGGTYRTIAAELYLSPTTIAYHADRLQKRLGVANNAALVAAAFMLGLLSLEVWPPELTGLTEVQPPPPNK